MPGAIQAQLRDDVDRNVLQVQQLQCRPSHDLRRGAVHIQVLEEGCAGQAKERPRKADAVVGVGNVTYVPEVSGIRDDSIVLHDESEWLVRNRDLFCKRKRQARVQAQNTRSVHLKTNIRPSMLLHGGLGDNFRMLPGQDNLLPILHSSARVL